MPDAGEQKISFRQVLFSHPNTTDETDLVEHLLHSEVDVHHFDFSNLLQQTTIRVFEKADGVNYELLSQKVFPDDFEVGIKVIIIVLDGGKQDMKITLQSSVAEGSAKDIPGTVRDEIRIS